ncbi:hypothetical protein [Knoellia subterranea]|uniref:hypothetical protein n=1 Tax=Knoellia subterranea TaxID=184882 RepID=UPI0012EB745A|nr:hypothetical protein [Knoellia subterranea]
MAKAGLESPDLINDEFEWQNEFSMVATRIAEDYPKSFAGSAIEDQAGRVASIAFKGSPPEGLMERFAHLDGVSVSIQRGRPASIEELDRDLERLHRSIASRTDLVQEVVSTYDPTTARFSVVASPTATTSSFRSEDVVADLRGAVDVDLNPRLELLELNASLETGGDAAYGGARLEVTGGSGLECTAGFNVRHASGVTGFATAGHCSNTLTLENTNGGAELGTTYQSGHRGPPMGSTQDPQTAWMPGHELPTSMTL